MAKLRRQISGLPDIGPFSTETNFAVTPAPALLLSQNNSTLSCGA